MFDLEKLHQNSQEEGEKFAYLVSFNNVNGWNNRESRLSLPSRFRQITNYDSNPEITFNDKNIVIKVKYRPSENAFTYFESLSKIARNNKSFLRFLHKNSNTENKEQLKIQLLPKNGFNSNLITWDNIKLKKVTNRYKLLENITESELVFVFDKLQFIPGSETIKKLAKKHNYVNSLLSVFKEFACKRSYIKNTNVDTSYLKAQELLDSYKLESKFDTEREMMDYILKSKTCITSSDLINELNEHEEICETDQPQKSENKSAE